MNYEIYTPTFINSGHLFLLLKYFLSSQERHWHFGSIFCF